MTGAVQSFLSHPFGLSIIGLAVVIAGLLAAWMARREPRRSNGRVILAAATPAPLLLAIVTAVLLLLSPWEDPLIGAVLITAGVLGTFFSLLAGLIVAAVVLKALRP